MNELVFSDSSRIILEQLNALTANTAFYHVDRIANMNVMIYVTSGCIYVTEDGHDYAVKEGELLFLKKGTHQCGKHKISAGTSWIYAHFQIEALNSNTLTVSLPKHIKLNSREDIGLRLRKLCELYSSSQLLAKNLATLGLQELLLDIYELTQAKREQGITEKIDEFIESNLHQNISSMQFEAYFHLTYKYLNRLYKSTYKESIMKAHAQRQILSAASELRMTNKSISQISEEHGFSDPLYFSKCFKKYMNSSPREYRRNAIQYF